MLYLNILKNGFEKNLNPPAKPGDIGFDLFCEEICIVGKTANNGQQSIIINDWDKDLKNIYWESVDYIAYNTKVQYELVNGKQDGQSSRLINYFGFGPPRSSNRKYNLLLANSAMTIDLGYRGDIIVCYQYQFQPKDYLGFYPQGTFVGTIDSNKVYKKGDAVAQLLFLNFATPTINIVDKLSDSERGTGGFGSTTK